MLDTRPRIGDIVIRENVFKDVKHDMVCVITDAMDILTQVSVRLDNRNDYNLPPASRPHETGEQCQRGLLVELASTHWSMGCRYTVRD